MKKTIQLITLALICFFMTVPLTAQDTNNIQNRVVNQYNQPVQNAVIETEDGKYISNAMTGTSVCERISEEKILDIPAAYLDSRISIAQLPDRKISLLAL